MNDIEIKISNHKRVLLMVVLMTLIVGAGVDIFVPSLPYIATYFHAKASLTRLAVTVYLISYGIFQLFMGSLSDAWGRKKVAVFSLIGYIVCTYLVMLSPSIYIFLLFRFLQGAFIAGVGVNCRAIISDSFSGKILAKYASYVLIAWAAGPIISPYIGGYLQLYIGWKANFFVLATYGMLVLILALFLLPETCSSFTHFSLNHFMKNYRQVIFDKRFIAGALICGFMYGFITVYNVAGPFLVQVELGYGPTLYGKIALLLGLGWLIGIFIFRYKIAKSEKPSPVLLVWVLSLVIAASWFVLGAMGKFNLTTAALPPILLFVLGAVIFSMLFAKTLSLFPHIGGTASAALGSTFSIISGLSSGAASFIKSNSLIPISLTYLGLILISYILYRLAFTSIPQAQKVENDIEIV